MRCPKHSSTVIRVAYGPMQQSAILLLLALLGDAQAALQRPLTAAAMRGSVVAQLTSFFCRDGVCLMPGDSLPLPQHAEQHSAAAAADISSSWVQESISAPTRKGELTWFDDTKGFGFISMTLPQGQALEVFVHHSDVSWPQHGYHRISSGAPLEFKLARNRDSGKFKAMRVTAPDGEPVRDSSEWMADFDEMFGI